MTEPRPTAVPTDQQQTTYQHKLATAGYGERQRTQYIETSHQDPEYAACVWDEQVVAGAEAAGIIPENPHPFSPAEEATITVRDAAISEFWAQHPEYDVFSNAPEHQALFRQAMEVGDQKARQVLGDGVVENLLSKPQAEEGPANHQPTLWSL